MNRPLALAVALTILAFTACRPAAEQNATNTPSAPPGAPTTTVPGAPVDACHLALMPRSGSQPVDREIAAMQGLVRNPRHPADAQQALEKLGWLYVREARRSFDAGFYSLAEQCAICLDGRASGSIEALFLRAYALHGLHRF
ncbi:MAG TPA: hypothetical protein VNO52_15085, partial [Methylomirabilota bacterium]|nr:hypothetical protein [Methylomirabilota bacterium]